MAGPINGSGIGFTPYPFGKTFQPGQQNDDQASARANITEQQTATRKNNTVRRREAISIQETRSESYRSGGTSEVRTRGDRGSVIDITV